jgi:hypothetical protein
MLYRKSRATLDHSQFVIRAMIRGNISHKE